MRLPIDASDLPGAIGWELARGDRRVESQTDLQAVIVEGHQPNHVLHLILTLLTLGAWAIVWILVAVVIRERRTLLYVDEWRNIIRR